MSNRFKAFSAVIALGTLSAPLVAASILGKTTLPAMINGMHVAPMAQTVVSSSLFTTAAVICTISLTIGLYISAKSDSSLRGFATGLSLAVVGVGAMAIAEFAVPAIASSSGTALATTDMQIILGSTYGGVILISALIAALAIGSRELVGNYG